MDDLNRHTYVAAEMLDGVVGDEIIRAIRSHGFWYTGVQPESKMEFVLVAADAISGLIIATALIVPSKKLADVKAGLVSKNYRKNNFARNCNRENITYCEKAGITLERFIGLSLEALQGVAHELGL
jgi:predicted hydrolase (HD superfamily)